MNVLFFLHLRSSVVLCNAKCLANMVAFTCFSLLSCLHTVYNGFFHPLVEVYATVRGYLISMSFVPKPNESFCPLPV